jgi:hypothetical protein
MLDFANHERDHVFSQYFRSGIVVKGGSWSRGEEPGSHNSDSAAAMGFSWCLLRILGGPLTTLRQEAGSRSRACHVEHSVQYGLCDPDSVAELKARLCLYQR